MGFAPAKLPSVEDGGPSAYLTWIARGMQGGMAYMARSPEDRCDITRWFPEARSVILCAFSYHDGTPAPETDVRRGRLARYSLPPDYHEELKGRMTRLRADFPDVNGRVFVDTSPVLERLYARYAGIGWIGKNTMVLSQRMGSFFLLAGLAVDCELEYDEPVRGHCGTCTRCLEACPTGAFPQPNVLDASKCIANFTIEQRKTPIPESLRKGHGDWIFGCDICQDVCPWNRFSVNGRVFAPQLEHTADLEALARLTPAEFNKRFKGTSLRRTGHAAMLRNVLLAMGNSKDPRYAPLLEEFSDHDNSMIAEQARWSLRNLSQDASGPPS